MFELHVREHPGLLTGVDHALDHVQRVGVLEDVCAVDHLVPDTPLEGVEHALDDLQLTGGEFPIVIARTCPRASFWTEFRTACAAAYVGRISR